MKTNLVVRFLGCGDAFGSGGRLQTCIHVESGSHRFLIDCGASAMVGMRANGVDPDAIDAVVLTHFHGDHCAGVAFLLVHAMVVSRRTRPLVIAGPVGTEHHVNRLLEVLFPGSAPLKPRFQLDFVELEHRVAAEFRGITVKSWPALHVPQTMPSIVRVTHAGRSLVYTGDTGWTEDIVEACDGADLLIAECYLDQTPTRTHLTLDLLRANRQRLNVAAMVLTHASDEILKRHDDLGAALAFDGMAIHV